MNYSSFSYITPPRAEAKIPVGLLRMYEKQNWVAQVKKNGTNSVIFVGPDRKPFAYNRHGEPHRQWKFDAASAELFRAIPGQGWYVFNAELLHSKVSGGPRNTNYVHDLLVADGEYLLGSTYLERVTLLEKLLFDVSGLFASDATFKTSHFELTPTTWLATWIVGNFVSNYEALSAPEDEGLVLKDPQGKLRTTDGKGAPWMAKIRRANKNLGF
jgi:hypothetical protein